MSGFLSTDAEFRSGYPVNVYLLILMPIMLLGVSLEGYGGINNLMTNLPILILLFYLLFSRHSNKVLVTGSFELNIIYFFPWDEDIVVDLDDFKALYYEKERLSCYTVIHLIDKETELPLVIQVNMKKSHLEQLFNFIEGRAGLEVKMEKLTT